MHAEVCNYLSTTANRNVGGLYGKVSEGESKLPLLITADCDGLVLRVGRGEVS